MPFRTALQAYVDQTQPYRKQAAQAAEQVPGKAAAATGAEASVRARQNVLAEALKTKLRPNAKQGDVFGRAATAAIRKQWRIGFFHHPLYSSGQHAGESRDVIRPALEPLLIRNGVNVVFSGTNICTSAARRSTALLFSCPAAGGRSLYDVRPSEFDEVAISEDHFMVAEIADSQRVRASQRVCA